MKKNHLPISLSQKSNHLDRLTPQMYKKIFIEKICVCSIQINNFVAHKLILYI